MVLEVETPVVRELDVPVVREVDVPVVWDSEVPQLVSCELPEDELLEDFELFCFPNHLGFCRAYRSRCRLWYALVVPLGVAFVVA